jgi:predicted O-methyltransferase YrrM
MTDLYRAYPSLEKVERADIHRINGRRQIVSLIPKKSVGAEIGVFTGVFSEFLMAKTRPKKLTLVDPWEKAHGALFPKWGDYTAQGTLETEAARRAAEKRAEKMPGKVSVVTDFSTNWLAGQTAGSLDWVYLDATHKYETVLEDLRAIERVLSSDGLILGDDCWTDPKAPHFGVFRAIRDFCVERPFEIFRIDHHGQWAVRRQSI